MERQKSYTFPFRLGNYIVFDIIGKGGMAEIFLAMPSGSLNGAGKVVLKRIYSHLSGIKTFVNALVNEARIMEKIHSPFVTRVLDVKRHNGEIFIVMEYVEGVDLNRLLGFFTRKGIEVPIIFIFHVMRSILQGLESVHEAKDEEGRSLNLIHLDLSPGNILVSFAGEVKICDFGVATSSEMTRVMAREKEIRGKFSYMSPEQASGLPLDRRSDLFSAGIVFWELLSGRRMYSSKNRNDVIKMATEAIIPPLPPGRFPRQEILEAIVYKALKKFPHERYSTATEFLEDIEKYIQNQGLIINQLLIGKMLEENFSEDILEVRMERERALSLLCPVEK